ncbi:unnamed protein product, partial [Iphiclides podalirius]
MKLHRLGAVRCGPYKRIAIRSYAMNGVRAQGSVATSHEPRMRWYGEPLSGERRGGGGGGDGAVRAGAARGRLSQRLTAG